MTQLDEQLAKIADASDAPAVSSAPRQNEGRPLTPAKRQWGLLIALSLIGVGLIALVAFSFKDAAVYAKTVDQVLAQQAHLTGKRIRVEGSLVHGTLKKRDTPCEYRFQIHSESNKPLAVRYPKCVIPDTFQDRPETEVKVTAEGTMTKDGHFKASLIMAKCPSKYEKRNGKTVPVGAY